jgi:hypothetical protein
MHLLTESELQDAAGSGEGLCLECGYRQEFHERVMIRFGLCVECGQQKVIRAVDLRDGLELLEVGE